MRQFAITVAYDGTSFGGWQFQTNAVSIQQRLQEAVETATSEVVCVHGSGRTDSGVHATGQVASFTLKNWKAPADRLVLALNRYLPRSIVVRKCREVVLGFDPIRNAKSKRYRYTIRNSKVPDPLQFPFQWWYPRELDVDAMREGACYLSGTHDFKAFETLGAPRKSSVRSVYELNVEKYDHEDGCDIRIEIEADGFLYNMVRNMAGALSAVGAGRFGPRWIKTVLESRERQPHSQTAPARGLCLITVCYPDSLFLDQTSSASHDRSAHTTDPDGIQSNDGNNAEEY